MPNLSRLPDALPRSLGRRYLRQTRYTVTATAPDGTVSIVGFTPRRSRSGLMTVLRERGQEIIETCGVGEDDKMTFAGGRFATATVSGWTFALSNLTERDVALSLEERANV